jgi:hypothetical protein
VNRKHIALLALAALVGCSGSDDDGDDNPPPQGWVEAFPAKDFGWLLAAWGPSPDDVYVVGGTPDEGKIMHWDGASWSEVTIGVPVPLINWTYGFGPNDITFVGSEGTVLHYDGSTFELQSTPTDQDLWGVWGSASNDLYAVGGNGREEGQSTILHYDGTAWTKTATPAHARPSVNAYFKVWGTSADNVYVVGQRGALARFDGTAFTEVESGASEDLVSLWGTGPNNIVAVGGRNNGQVVIYDGTSWRRESLAPLPGLNGVWMRSPDVAYIGGAEGTLATLNVSTASYETEPVDTTLSIHALFGTSDGTLLAVGGSLLTTQPPHEGVAVKRSIGPAQ